MDYWVAGLIGCSIVSMFGVIFGFDFVLSRGGDEPKGESSPTWSADGTRLAFSSDESGIFDIWVRSIDDTEGTNLTKREARDTEPAWSPDGEWIAFLSRTQGRSDIHRVRPDGTGLSNITVFAGQQYSRPVWSPDGAKIAFTSNREASLPVRFEPTPPAIGDGPPPNFPGAAPLPELYVMNADGGSQKRLTFNVEFEGNPTWSPDGRNLAFQSRIDGNQEIYVIGVNGTGLTRLTDNNHADVIPAWSPDGRFIAFSSNRPKTEFGELLAEASLRDFSTGGAPTDYDIYLMNTEDGSVFNWTQISDSNDSSPSWSPDGGWIAYEGRYALSFSLRDGINEIYLMRLKGIDRGLTKLTNAQTANPDENLGPVVWSPDGKNIAFVTARDGTPRIQVVRVFRPS